MTLLKKLKVTRKRFFILSIVFFIFITVSLTLCMTLIPRASIELEGEKVVSLPVFSEYTSSGARAEYLWFDVTDKIVCSADVDTGRVGEYTERYTLDHLGRSYSAERKVRVYDDKPPILELNGKESIVVSSLLFYNDEGVSAYDEYDGDLTEDVVVDTLEEDGKVTFVYTVTDSSGNCTQVKREVTLLDAVPPVITLVGESSVFCGTSYYKDPGCSASDDMDGDISEAITVTTDYVPGVTGRFHFTYTVKDSSGNESSVTRSVQVADREEPVISLSGDLYIVLEEGDAYSEPGYYAYDAFDGDITDSVTVAGEVDTKKIGTYTVSYSVKDGSGNGFETSRTIVINRKINRTVINAPYIYQRTDYPNGCESVSTVMALNHIGIDITVDEFIDGYLEMGESPVIDGIGPDPSVEYCGDPRSKSGWGCYDTVIAKSLNKLSLEGDFTYERLTGASLDYLCKEYIDCGIPVIIWGTTSMRDANHPAYFVGWKTEDGKDIVYNKALHCLLLVGYDDAGNYYFNDPLAHGSAYGYATAYSVADTEAAYRLLGRQCIVVLSE